MTKITLLTPEKLEAEWPGLDPARLREAISRACDPTDPLYETMRHAIFHVNGEVLLDVTMFWAMLTDQITPDNLPPYMEVE